MVNQTALQELGYLVIAFLVIFGILIILIAKKTHEMEKVKKWYYNGYWIYLIEDSYCPSIDGSQWATLEGAKAHIDFLTI